MKPWRSSSAMSALMVAELTLKALASRLLPTGLATSAYCSTIALKTSCWRSVMLAVPDLLIGGDYSVLALDSQECQPGDWLSRFGRGGTGCREPAVWRRCGRLSRLRFRGSWI